MWWFLGDVFNAKVILYKQLAAVSLSQSALGG
jgi:hypothetical protein